MEQYLLVGEGMGGSKGFNFTNLLLNLDINIFLFFTKNFHSINEQKSGK